MAYRSSSQYAPGTNVTSVVLPVPAGAAIGDIAVVGIYIESTATITPPAGFTAKSDLATSAVAHGRLVVYWKRLSAADTGNYTFTFTSAFCAAACGLWSGRIASGDPFDGTVGTSEPGAQSTTVNVSTSPTGSSGDAVGMWTNFNGGGTFTAPASYTQRQSVSGVIAMETRDAVASGSTGNVTATNTITDWMKAFLGVLAIASSGFTGTAAVTQANQTSSASGQLGYSGTSATTEANDTSSATGTVVNPVTGTAAVTQANQTSSASGQLGYSGTSARTQANQTSSASGQLGYTGTSAQTQANQTSTASGTYTAGGSFSGSAAVTQANNTSAASGTVVNPVTGTASPVQANQTSAATGQLGYSGTLARTQANQTSNASGLVITSITGTAAAVQANQTSSASGSFAGLVTFGTASAGVMATAAASPASSTAPASSGATGTAAGAQAASGAAAQANAGTLTVPTATGG